MLVAVVGLGSVGMIALKNFLEEGLDVVGFEKGVQGELSIDRAHIVLPSLPFR